MAEHNSGWLKKLGADAASQRLARIKRRWFELHVDAAAQGSTQQQHELRYYVKQVEEPTSALNILDSEPGAEPQPWHRGPGTRNPAPATHKRQPKTVGFSLF